MKRYDAAVIGGGLAGASVAAAVGSRGLKTGLFESLPHLAGRASGNAFGIVMPYLADRASPLLDLYGPAFQYSTHLIHALGTPHFKTGALQLPTTKRLAALIDLGAANDAKRLPYSVVTQEEATHIAGVHIQTSCLWAPEAIFLNPPTFIDSLISSAKKHIELHPNAQVTKIERLGEPENKDSIEWRIFTASSGVPIASANHLIVCGAYESNLFDETGWLPLEPVRGQIASVHSSSLSRQIQCLICFDGYITPEVRGQHLVGAHYRHHDPEPGVKEEDTLSVLNRCAAALPDINLERDRVASARVCFRTSTLDRRPYIGRVPDFAGMAREAGTFQSGTSIRNRVPIRYIPNLYISAGHGSRGLLSTPLGGEIIARMIAGERIGDFEQVVELVTPTRIVYRLLNRS